MFQGVLEFVASAAHELFRLGYGKLVFLLDGIARLAGELAVDVGAADVVEGDLGIRDAGLAAVGGFDARVRRDGRAESQAVR